MTFESTTSLPSSSALPATVAPLERPSALSERAGQFLLQALSPRLPKIEPTAPPPTLEPAESFEIERRGAPGTLAATWYPAEPSTAESQRARGVVLLVHPWHGRGQAYFHRHRRVPSLREEGYHVMTFDLGGIGASGPRRRDFTDGDVADAIEAGCRRAAGLPVHLWGVSIGGYWSHLALLEESRIRSMVFEDVTRHPLVWSHRQAPWGRPFYLFFEYALRESYRYLDLYRQAQHLRDRPTAWVSGALDRSVLPEETRELARRAGGRVLIVEDADHLECIRRGRRQVVELALQTFAAG